MIAFQHSKLFKLLVCPHCKSPLCFDVKHNVLLCKPEQLAYPLIDGVPYLLESHVRDLQDTDEQTLTQADGVTQQARS